MNEYIFRIPENCPELNFTSLTAWMGSRDSRTIGMTVDVSYLPATGDSEGEIWAARFEFRLYGLLIAWIFPDRVYFPGPDDPHMATTYWITKIVRDNAISGQVGRIRRHKADGPGPQVPRGQAGLLVIGGRDRPVFGRTYPVGDIREMHRRDAEWAEQSRQRQAEYAEESRRREALKTWTGPEGTFYASDDYSHEHGSYWRAVDGTFRDGGAGYDTVGYVHDTRPGRGASPEPETGPLAPPFEAFAASEDGHGPSLGTWSTLAAALAVIAHENARATA